MLIALYLIICVTTLIMVLICEACVEQIEKQRRKIKELRKEISKLAEEQAKLEYMKGIER